jgi:hypothetical protein
VLVATLAMTPDRPLRGTFLPLIYVLGQAG